MKLFYKKGGGGIPLVRTSLLSTSSAGLRRRPATPGLPAQPTPFMQRGIVHEFQRNLKFFFLNIGFSAWKNRLNDYLGPKNLSPLR